MKAIKFIIIQSLPILFILITVVSCSLDDEKNNYYYYSQRPTSDLSLIANDADFTTNTFDEITKEALEVEGIAFAYLKSAQNDYCRNITYSPSDSVYPRTVTIDYGTKGCYNRRGVVKTGKIILSLTAPPTDSLSTITIALDSLTVNGYKVEGTKTLTYMGKINGQPTWTSQIAGGKISARNGNYITYNVLNWTRKQIAGINTSNFWDNIYAVNGVSIETAKRDTAITSYRDSVASDNPLIMEAACRFPQGGVLDITLTKNDSTLRNVKVDYGAYVPDTSICKHSATVTVNGKVVNNFSFKE
jgi:hypothetical protein